MPLLLTPPQTLLFRGINTALDERFRPLYAAPVFSGIVEQTGAVAAINPADDSLRLTVAARGLKRLKIGHSLAVNGVCLTVVKLQRARGSSGRVAVSFDVLKETSRVTNLQFLKTGDLVNLEQSLRASDPIGGHFVLGHVDGVGKVTRWEKIGNDWLLEIAPPCAVRPYLVYKGSVAVDGISLTIAKVLKKTFQIWIIPHTFEVTNLRTRRVGDAVNLEADMIGKYIREFVASMDLNDRRELAAAKTRNKGKPGTPWKQAAKELGI